MPEERLDRLEGRVHEMELHFVELRKDSQIFTEAFVEVRGFLKDIRDALTGDPADESRPGLVIRLDRLDQRAKSHDKVLWALGSSVLALIVESVRGFMG